MALHSTHEKKWMLGGMVMGLSMFLVLDILWPLLDGSGLQLHIVVVMFGIWMLVGLVWGWLMKEIYPPKKNKHD